MLNMVQGWNVKELHSVINMVRSRCVVMKPKPLRLQSWASSIVRCLQADKRLAKAWARTAHSQIRA